MNKPIAAGMIIAHLRPITSATKPQAPLARNPTRLDAQFPGLGLLRARDGERSLEVHFSFRCVWLRCDIIAISPAVRCTSASNHFSLVASIAVIASPMLCHASSNCPSIASRLAKSDSRTGANSVVPVASETARYSVSILSASVGLPVKAKIQAFVIIALPFQRRLPF